MMHWKPPQKPGELTESRLINAILDNHFPPGSNLPGERELAVQFGVTRPTLREVLQRLERDGWVEIRQGKPTRVCNYWQEGNLAVLVAVALYQGDLPPDFVPDLLYVRVLLAPAYTRRAIERDSAAVAAVLENPPAVDDPAGAFAAYDYQVHKQLTILSQNPVFTLFINSVTRLYRIVGSVYFIHPEARVHSLGYYQDLLDCARRQDSAAAHALTERIMRQSLDLWKTHIAP
ncbi:MAG TPA: fatty acid metabolism transcriptional regulator FadR [Levilinea sp.]|nr:fatty acid metabolism transcriptional regulator FadR [Levilinea sp.]